MTGIKEHLDSDGSLMSIFTRRFSRHPERYIEILREKRRVSPQITPLLVVAMASSRSCESLNAA